MTEPVRSPDPRAPRGAPLRAARSSASAENSILGAVEWPRLLEGVRRGDEAAREQLVARFYPRVSAIVHRELERDLRPRRPWIWPLFSTGDIVQEVFVSAVDSMDRFTGSTEPDGLAFICQR